MNLHRSEESIVQNMEDAGCGEETIEQFLKCLKKGSVDQQLLLLSRYRRSLLEKLHEGQKKIDCLDYLIYQIQKQKEEESGIKNKTHHCSRKGEKQNER